MLPVVPLAHRLLAALCLLLAALVASPSFAGEPSDGFPIIAGGREAEIRALIAPHAMDREIAPGATLASIAISATTIRFLVKGPSGATATLRLEHPGRAPSAERTASFALHREIAPAQAGAGLSAATLDPLASALRDNDKGAFWPEARPVDRTEPARSLPGSAPGTLKVEERSTRWELTLRRKLLLAGLVASLVVVLGDRLRRRPAAG